MSIQQRPIEHEVLWVAIRRLMQFRFPQICRHLVALELLTILEQHGATIDPELATAITQADDWKALECMGEKV